MKLDEGAKFVDARLLFVELEPKSIAENERGLLGRCVVRLRFMSSVPDGLKTGIDGSNVLRKSPVKFVSLLADEDDGGG